MQVVEIRDEDVGFESQPVSEWSERRAARGVLMRGSRVVLLHVRRDGYHKLPGGGVEAEESLMEGLRREVREEVGSSFDIVEELGDIVEHKTHEGVMQRSTCFLLRETKRGEPSFTEKEKREGFAVESFSLAEAIMLLEEERPSAYVPRFINHRDLLFLRQARTFLD